MEEAEGVGHRIPFPTFPKVIAFWGDPERTREEAKGVEQHILLPTSPGGIAFRGDRGRRGEEADGVEHHAPLPVSPGVIAVRGSTDRRDGRLPEEPSVPSITTFAPISTRWLSAMVMSAAAAAARAPGPCSWHSTVGASVASPCSNSTDIQNLKDLGFPIQAVQIDLRSRAARFRVAERTPAYSEAAELLLSFARTPP